MPNTDYIYRLTEIYSFLAGIDRTSMILTWQMVTTFLLQMQKFTLPFKLLTVLIDDVLSFIAHYVVVNPIVLNVML